MEHTETTLVDAILNKARYTQWDSLEQAALAEMLSNHKQGHAFAQGAFQTARVTATFIKILCIHNE